MFALSSWDAGKGNQDGGKEKRVGHEGRDTDEGGEEGNLAFPSERKRTGSKGAVHGSLLNYFGPTRLD